MNENITIDDVARAAGVGKGTVDRVLHNRGRVADATREKVLQCIAELHYRPNKIARMLAKKRSYRIAVCFQDKEKEFWDQVKTGVNKAGEEYEQMGVKIIPFYLPQISVQRQLDVIHQVVEEKYDGLAIVPYCSEKIKDAINEAVCQGLEVITFNNYEEGVNACYVGAEGLQSGRTAGRLMSLFAKPDARYIVISSHNRLMFHIDERVRGFEEVIESSRSDMHYIGRFGFEEDYNKIYNFVVDALRRDEFDAIYAANECLSVIAKAASDVKPEHKVYIIGHDLTPTIVQLVQDGWIDASIGQEPERQGYRSVEKICKKLLMGEKIVDEYTRISIVVKENLDFFQ